MRLDPQMMKLVVGALRDCINAHGTIVAWMPLPEVYKESK